MKTLTKSQGFCFSCRNFEAMILTSPPLSNLLRGLALLSLTCLITLNGLSQERYEAILLGNWNDETIVGSENHNNSYNETWGIAINGKEYGIIGSTGGTHFIDVTDVDNITEAFLVPGGSVGSQIIHRDFHSHNGYLYAVADQGVESTLQIIDITQLPEKIEVVYDSGEFSNRTHNIYIDTFTNRLYLCKTGGDNLDRIGMRILDISNPIEPVLIYEMLTLEGFGPIDTVHDAYVVDNVAYLNIGNQGFAIVDFTDIDNPQILATLFPDDYQQSGYNHSGWATPDQKYYYMADENHGLDIKVVDLQDRPDIYVTDTIDANNDLPFSIPHNLIVHDNYLYASYYYDGLQIYDLTDPAHPVNVSFYPTTDIEHKARWEGAWGVYPFLPSGKILVSDMQNGLFVLKLPALSSVEDQNDEPTFVMSPNPSSGEVTIDISQLYTKFDSEVYVTSLEGKLVMKQSVINESLSFILDPGLYFVQLKSGSTCLTQKLIVRN